MQLKIISVSARQPDWLVAGVAEYAKRLTRFAQIQWAEVKPAPATGGTAAARRLEREAAQIAAQLPARACCIALDVRGRKFTTEQFAHELKSLSMTGQTLVFVIGGADGLAPEFVRGASLVLSLSDLTLPHGLARLVLAEQLYRACSWLAGHPYHRE